MSFPCMRRKHNIHNIHTTHTEKQIINIYVYCTRQSELYIKQVKVVTDLSNTMLCYTRHTLAHSYSRTHTIFTQIYIQENLSMHTPLWLLRESTAQHHTCCEFTCAAAACSSASPPIHMYIYKKKKKQNARLCRTTAPMAETQKDGRGVCV